MAKENVDLLIALGKPEKGKEKGETKSYLEGKSPELRAYLEDAVNPELSNEQRAEALCRALEFSPVEEEEVVEEAEEMELPEEEEDY
jgi:hypothetical protein